MKIIASDIMTTRFHTLTPLTPVNDAVKLFKQANEEEGRKIFGMMVVDAEGQLVGMISMYDILLFMRPKHTHIWGMMEDINIAGIVDVACKKTKSVLVGDIMTPEVITITPQTHILMILDIKEIMTNEVKSVLKDDSLFQVMEELSVYRFGAILVKDRKNTPCGVISKTDLTLAYKHGVDSKHPQKPLCHHRFRAVV